LHRVQSNKLHCTQSNTLHCAQNNELYLYLEQYFNNISVTKYIVAVSFIRGGNQSNRRYPSTCGGRHWLHW